MEEEKRISVKTIIRFVIIGIIAILVLSVIFRLAATMISNNFGDYSEDELIGENGQNAGQIDYSRRYVGRIGSWCEIKGRDNDGEKVHIRLLAERGWARFDVVNMRYAGDLVNVKLTELGLYLWQNDANPKYGYFYKVGSPSYARIIGLLKFEDLDIKKTRFGCENRDSYVNYLALPNIEWE